MTASEHKTMVDNEAHLAGVQATMGCRLMALRGDHEVWSRNTFGPAVGFVKALGVLRHLEKEAREAQDECVAAQALMDEGGESYVALRERVLREVADIQLLLLDVLWRTDHGIHHLLTACEDKMAVNKTRKWAKPVDGQPCEHVRE